jgi:hypothetical protein
VRSLVAAVAIALAAVPVSASGASPTPDPFVLRTALVDAPDVNWVESTPGASQTLEGPFDAAYFVATAYDDQTTRDDVSKRLAFDGFLGGYGRTFEKVAARAWIIEEVKAFPDVAHALSFWGWYQINFHTDPTTSVDTSVIPSSFGDDYLLSGFHGTQILFPKAAYVYSITLGSYPTYMTAGAVAQALAAYRHAPSAVPASPESNAVPAAATNRVSGLVAVGVISAAVGLVALIGVVVLIVLITRRRRPADPRAILSSDGNFWWDGTGWQPVARQ